MFTLNLVTPEKKLVTDSEIDETDRIQLMEQGIEVVTA